MQRVFEEVASLDARCYEHFFLSEDILMEHAARGMAEYICNNCKKDAKIIIVCGSGNNGADGMALGRLLHAALMSHSSSSKNPHRPWRSCSKKEQKVWVSKR